MSKDHAIIDTDIHAVLSGRRIGELLPEPWRTRWASGNRGPGHLGYWNPNGVMRSDTGLPDGTRIESSPANLARHFFDVYRLEYGILNAGGLHIGLSPDPDFAAAVIAAENDVVAQDWLPADPRFRASLAVSPADPELAAREIHRLGDHPGFVQVLMPSGARMPYGQRFYHPIYAAAVAHEPWPLHDAWLEACDQTLTRWAGLPADGRPDLVHYSPGVHTRIGAPRSVAALRAPR